MLCGFLFPHLKRECQKYVNFSWGMQMCECLNVSEVVVMGKRMERGYQEKWMDLIFSGDLIDHEILAIS